MVLVMSSEHEADVAALMRVLLHPADGQSSWMRRVAAHVSALAVAPSAVVLTMRSGERLVEGDAAAEVLAERLADYGALQAPGDGGVRVRTVATVAGTSRSVVEMSTWSAESGMHGMVVVHFAPGRPPAAPRQAADLLRLVLPVFRFAVSHHFARRADLTAHAPRWGLDAAAATTRRLIAALDEPCAYCTLDGEIAWRNGPMDQLLAEESDRDGLLHELSDAARQLADGSGFADDNGTMRVDLCTPTKRYRIRFVMLSRKADAPGAIAAIVLRRKEISGEMAVQLSGRYGLTAREEEVARLLLSGRSNEAIAQILQISAHTARHHTQRVLEKTGAHSRAEVAFIAARSRRSGEHRQSVGVREVVVQPAEA